jgi:hypothetical protein
MPQAIKALLTRAWIPFLTASIVLIVYELLGLGRNWALMFLTVPLLLLLSCIAVALGFALIFEWRSAQTRSTATALACVIVALVGIPAAIAYGGPLRDPLRFLLWWQTHPGEIATWAGKDAVVQHWDAWGFAGLENDSYLVSDAGDSIADLAAADRWAQDRNLDCGIAATQRMWRGFYILTTENCEFRLPSVSPPSFVPPAPPLPARSVPE